LGRLKWLVPGQLVGQTSWLEGRIRTLKVRKRTVECGMCEEILVGRGMKEADTGRKRKKRGGY
jgi:hypothetical protein